MFSFWHKHLCNLPNLPCQNVSDLEIVLWIMTWKDEIWLDQPAATKRHIKGSLWLINSKKRVWMFKKIYISRECALLFTKAFPSAIQPVVLLIAWYETATFQKYVYPGNLSSACPHIDNHTDFLILYHPEMSVMMSIWHHLSSVPFYLYQISEALDCLFTSLYTVSLITVIRSEQVKVFHV